MNRVLRPSVLAPPPVVRHKGQAGRIGVIGGCEEYTGAPFFSAMTAMRMGADLVHVFCERSAAPVIKSYSPDLIVHPYLLDSLASVNQDSPDKIAERIASWFERLHVLVIGPGAGRDPRILDTLHKLTERAKSMQLPIVLDADGLFLIQQKPQLISGYRNAVLTPNRVEFERLCKAMAVPCPPREDAEETESVRLLSKAMGHVTVVRKGDVDVISNGHTIQTCTTPGSPRRVGGQGDVLSGAIATFFAWSQLLWNGAEELTDHQNGDRLLFVAQAGCIVTRESSRITYEQWNQSMITSDILPNVGKAYRSYAAGELAE